MNREHDKQLGNQPVCPVQGYTSNIYVQFHGTVEKWNETGKPEHFQRSGTENWCEIKHQPHSKNQKHLHLFKIISTCLVLFASYYIQKSHQSKTSTLTFLLLLSCLFQISCFLPRLPKPKISHIHSNSMPYKTSKTPL